MLPEECACSQVVKPAELATISWPPRCRRGVALEAQPARFAVAQRLTTVPPCGLQPGPGGGNRDDREQTHLDDLEDLVPTLAPFECRLVLAELVRDLHIHAFGHGISSSRFLYAGAPER